MFLRSPNVSLSGGSASKALPYITPPPSTAVTRVTRRPTTDPHPQPPRGAASPLSLPPKQPAMAKLPSCLLLVFLAAVVTLAHASSSAHAVTAAGGLSDPENECVYTVYVRTGSIWKGGTDSKISVTLLGADGSGFRVTDLEQWGGLMAAGHNYFERGNLDIFSGRAPCLRSSSGSAPCLMNLTSDGTGAHHGWYCNYVEVTSTGPHLGCAQTLFTVEQWLATDASPYRLYKAVDLCGAANKNQEDRSPAVAM